MERVEKLRSFLASNPDDPFLNHALALELIKVGNDTEARSLFERILSANPMYVGSYYHLGKLLERNSQHEDAAAWYQKGMQAAAAAGDQHALNELRAAYAEITD